MPQQLIVQLQIELYIHNVHFLQSVDHGVPRKHEVQLPIKLQLRFVFKHRLHNDPPLPTVQHVPKQERTIFRLTCKLQPLPVSRK